LPFAGAALIGAALYFVALQLFVIGAICKFCMGAHTCGLLAGVLILRRTYLLGTIPSGLPPEISSKFGVGLLGRSISGGLLLVGLMAVGQAIHKPKTFLVQSSPGLAERKAPRIVELHDGRFQLDLSDIPVHGWQGASNVVIHMY